MVQEEFTAATCKSKGDVFHRMHQSPQIYDVMSTLFETPIILFAASPDHSQTEQRWTPHIERKHFREITILIAFQGHRKHSKMIEAQLLETTKGFV